MTPALEFTGSNDAVQRNFDALAGLQPATVTSLPVSATDGSEIFYVADAANGVIWHFRYNAGSSSAYKWESVGGSPLLATVDTAQTTASATFADLATVGPSVTVPLAGDYVIAHGARIFNNTAGFATMMSYAIGASAAADADDVDNYGAAVAAGATNAANNARENKKTGLAASTALVAKYRVGGGTGTFQSRWLRVYPVRVG